VRVGALAVCLWVLAPNRLLHCQDVPDRCDLGCVLDSTISGLYRYANIIE
jgi:hypothetical protein